MSAWPTREDWGRHLDWVRTRPSDPEGEAQFEAQYADIDTLLGSLSSDELRILIADFREEHKRRWDSLPEAERAARTDALIEQDRIDNPGAYQRGGAPSVPWALE